MSAENPGSFDEWSQQHTVGSSEVLYSEYGRALEHYRQSLAEERGITVEELHDGHMPSTIFGAGELAVAHEARVGVDGILENA